MKTYKSLTNDAEYSIVLMPEVTYLHLGQFFTFRTLLVGGKKYKLPVCGFTLTLPSQLIKITKKKKKEKFTKLNYLFVQYDTLAVDGNTLTTKTFREIIPLTANYQQKLIELVNGIGEITTEFPVIPVSEEFINEFASEGELRKVEPNELYNHICSKIEQYLDLDVDSIKILALWSIGTYFYQLFDAYPFLYLFGMWQSGKTKALTLLSYLTFLGTLDIDVSSPAFFRTAEDFGLTLLLDETEYLAEGETAKQLKKLIYARYKKSGGYVQRVEGDKKKYVKNFQIYGPLAIASIRDIDPLIFDRAIKIFLRRGRGEKSLLWPSHEDEDFQKIRDDLYRLMLQEWVNVYNIYQQTNQGWLAGREWELWRPLIVIAKLVGESDEWIKNISIKYSQQKIETIKTERIELLIMQALINIVTEDGYYSNRMIREEVLKWVEDDEDKAEIKRILSAKKLGNIMAMYGFSKKRTAKGYEYYIERNKILDLAERWGICSEQTNLTQQTENNANEGEEKGEWDYGVCELCGKTSFIKKVDKYYACIECRKTYDPTPS